MAWQGTMGNTMGIYLESRLGASNVWVQGVGGAYKAALLDNLAKEGTTQAAIDEMMNLLKRANSLCPNAKIVAAGYRYECLRASSVPGPFLS